jgi:hypothetical protein
MLLFINRREDYKMNIGKSGLYVGNVEIEAIIIFKLSININFVSETLTTQPVTLTDDQVMSE